MENKLVKSEDLKAIVTRISASDHTARRKAAMELVGLEPAMIRQALSDVIDNPLNLAPLIEATLGDCGGPSALDALTSREVEKIVSVSKSIFAPDWIYVENGAYEPISAEVAVHILLSRDKNEIRRLKFRIRDSGMASNAIIAAFAGQASSEDELLRYAKKNDWWLLSENVGFRSDAIIEYLLGIRDSRNNQEWKTQTLKMAIGPELLALANREDAEVSVICREIDGAFAQQVEDLSAHADQVLLRQRVIERNEESLRSSREPILQAVSDLLVSSTHESADEALRDLLGAEERKTEPMKTMTAADSQQHKNMQYLLSIGFFDARNCKISPELDIKSLPRGDENEVVVEHNLLGEMTLADVERWVEANRGLEIALKTGLPSGEEDDSSL